MSTSIGSIKEVKNNENRVGLTPAGVKELTADGHKVFVEKGAGIGAGFSDEEYVAGGAEMMETPEEVVQACDILVKVKEPVQEEYRLLDMLKGKTLYTYLHLSGVDKGLTMKLLENEITSVAYETVEDEKGQLPLLAPMSEIAGVLAVQYGAQYLQKKYHGIGVTLGSIHGADPAETVVIGGGFVGATCARTATGMGGNVTIVNRSAERLERLKKEFTDFFGEKLASNVSFVQLNDENLRAAVAKADLLVGAVLVPGARAPQVVTEEMVGSMKKGAVIVDVSIDQGGCIWGARPTSHSEPIYEIDGKIFCCITNMPGQVARQSTQALTHATLPYLKMMAAQGSVASVAASLKGDGRFARGINTYRGKITYESVADDLDLKDRYQDLKGLIV
ncbi:alanine dehydrogenase [Patescibacteria group bacterium]|nr:alanine dehydrogenase [Patescibacteria group bacterium]MBU1953502.1 alanine dehydrogenase [Patescibacteria group bacterium]